jgi:hypothetical protein
MHARAANTSMAACAGRNWEWAACSAAATLERIDGFERLEKVRS